MGTAGVPDLYTIIFIKKNNADQSYQLYNKAFYTSKMKLGVLYAVPSNCWKVKASVTERKQLSLPLHLTCNCSRRDILY